MEVYQDMPRRHLALPDTCTIGQPLSHVKQSRRIVQRASWCICRQGVAGSTMQPPIWRGYTLYDMPAARLCLGQPGEGHAADVPLAYEPSLPARCVRHTDGETHAVRRDHMPRVCSICTHADRRAVEAALHAGTPLRTIAARWSASKPALLRHRDRHGSPQPQAQQVIPPVAPPAAAPHTLAACAAALLTHCPPRCASGSKRPHDTLSGHWTSSW
jgi:hypothetical protein